jgi:uncharacterized small protein (DUF1192 family)
MNMARDDDDDARPVGRKALLQPPLLDTLSIVELESYVLELKNEILRVEEAVTAKRGVRAGADSLFRKKDG